MLKVNPTIGCPNCPFGKPAEDPRTGQFGYICNAHTFMGKPYFFNTEPGLPAKCPLRNGSITVGVEEKS